MSFAPAAPRAARRHRFPGPLAVAALGAGLIALVAPLGDPDLPIHLSVGAWIFHHGHVPLTEPFAWTRDGQPYYAYSWLAETTYYALLRLGGPPALHLLQGLVGAGAVLAGAALARGRGWSAGVAAALGAVNFAAMSSVANELRPQQLLFLLVPLAWVLADAAERLEAGGAGQGWRGGARQRVPLLGGHLLLGCVAANTHLFFPLTAAPLALTAARTDAARARRLVLPALFLVAGWLVSPYGLLWPEVFRLNFGRNVLLLRPPAIGELEPGFEAMRDVAGGLVVAVLLLALPWWRPRAGTAALVAPAAPGADAEASAPAPEGEESAPAAPPATAADTPADSAPAVVASTGQAPTDSEGGSPARADAGESRTRIVEALTWAGGLIAFAFAYRLLAVWWLALLPTVGERVRAAAAALTGRAWPRRAGLAALAVLMLVTGVPPWPRELRLEAGVGARTLPTHAAAGAIPLADWLVCSTDRLAGGRIFTTFNYGSYLTWRLPRYSVSIDGRTLFPDSVAREFAWDLAGRRRPHARTWASADLALLPTSLAVTDAIAADTGWVRLRPIPNRAGVGLWVRRAWWARWARPPAGASPDRSHGGC